MDNQKNDNNSDDLQRELEQLVDSPENPYLDHNDNEDIDIVPDSGTAKEQMNKEEGIEIL